MTPKSYHVRIARNPVTVCVLCVALVCVRVYAQYVCDQCNPPCCPQPFPEPEKRKTINAREWKKGRNKTRCVKESEIVSVLISQITHSADLIWDLISVR